MDTAPTTVAQDLMVLLRYGDKGTVQKIMVIAPTTVAQDLMVLLRYRAEYRDSTEDHGHSSNYRGAGPHGPTQVPGGIQGQYSNYVLQKIMITVQLRR
jgi:hypothetical protein